MFEWLNVCIKQKGHVLFHTPNSDNKAKIFSPF